MSENFYVGIDLGTSRTSVVTSTGKQATVKTCIGFPKDVISMKRLGREYLLGDEALENRLAVDLVWPLAEGVICDDEQAAGATGRILSHVIEQALPEKKAGDQVYAAIGVPARAGLRDKKKILKITQGIIDKNLIVSEPFAVAYALDSFDESLVVDIGAGTTDLCRLHGSLPYEEDQITLKTAGNFLDDELMKAILKKYPDVQLTSKIIQSIKEKHGYIADTADPVKVNLSSKGIPGEYDITDILRESCLKLTDPICKAVQNLIGSFDPDFQERLRNNIIVAGGGSRLKGIDLAIEKSLEAYGGGNVSCVQDAEYCGAIGALKMSMEMPEEYWEKI
jgi:rod shape-determining protein MreB